MDCLETKCGVETERQGEQGFMLVGLIVAIFLILLALSVAAPKVTQNLRREQEVEAIHRGNQYVRAIRLYYRKTNTYPARIEQLEKTTNIRYLRQRYVDPITGKEDWRLIHVGEAKTTVKGFFGQPLAGLAGAGMGSPTGSNAGAAGAGQTGLTSAYGSPGGGGGGSGSSSGGLGSSSGGLGSSSPGTGGGLGGSTLGGTTTGGGLGSSPAGTGTAPSTIGASAGIGGQSASTFSGSAQPFVGVGVPKEGDSITVLNEQTTYNTWEFIYDPRIEQLYAKGALLGAGASALGSGSGSSMGSGSGSSPSGLGNSPNSGTGLGSGSGLGTMPGSTSPTTPTSPQQPY
jgi:type II secretory pathway pseudopilin PulG